MSILRTLARSFARRAVLALKDNRTWIERNRTRPILMILEDRTAPAILTVSSLADGPVSAASSALTLREAVVLIDSGGTATDASGNSLAAAKAGQINSTSPFGVNDTIQFAPGLFGSGAQQIVLVDGTLQLNANATVTGPSTGQLAISGNNQSTVLAVAPGASVSISGLTIEGGAGSGNSAGGIVNAGTLTLVDTVITDNSAVTGNAGGLVNNGTLTLVDTTVSGNVTYNNGGIDNNGGTVTLTNSSVSGNTAILGNGGIGNYGGVLMLVNSSVSGNIAAAAGGIGNYANSSATLINSSVTGNSATTNVGGGIFNTATLTLTDSNISDNAALDGDGGGLINLGTATLINSTVSGNAARNDGGLYNSGTMELSGSTVSGNTAILGNGGLANYGGSVMLQNSSITGNSALVAGGIGNYSYGSLTLLNSIVSNNYASVRPGGIYNTATLSVTDSTIADNTSLHGDGGGLTNVGTATLLGSTLSGNTASNDGGLYNSGILLLSDSIVSGNSAVLGNGGLANYGTGNLTLLNSTVSGNSALVAGGIGNYDYGTMTVSDTTVSDNYASVRPGGIFNTATLTVSDSTIDDNTSLHGSGAGLNNLGTATLVNTTVSGNTASDDGGIENTGSLTLVGTTVAGNTAVIGNSDLGNDGAGSLNVDSTSVIGSTPIVSASITPVVDSQVDSNNTPSAAVQAPVVIVVSTPSNSDVQPVGPTPTDSVARSIESTPTDSFSPSNRVVNDVDNLHDAEAALVADHVVSDSSPQKVASVATDGLATASAIALASQANTSGNESEGTVNVSAAFTGSEQVVSRDSADAGLSNMQSEIQIVADGTATASGRAVADDVVSHESSAYAPAEGMKPAVGSQETSAVSSHVSPASEWATMEMVSGSNSLDFGAETVVLLDDVGHQDSAFQAEWTPGYYLAGMILFPWFPGYVDQVEEKRKVIRV